MRSAVPFFEHHLRYDSVQGSSLVSRTRIKTLAYDTVLANARFFDNNIAAVPKMALTVGVGTVLDSREVVLVVTGQSKSLALSKAIGMPWCLFLISETKLLLNRGRGKSLGENLRFSWRNRSVDNARPTQWTCSALQQHPWSLIVVDEDATAGQCSSISFIAITEVKQNFWSKL